MTTRSPSPGRHLAVLGTLTVFAIAMAFLESAIVVYLRAIFYPAGFGFPLKPIDPGTYAIEIGREAFTLVMLATVARLAGAPGWGRFACFAFLFGVWDIWYYIWLKVFLGWPASLLTWDILFLIPVAWIGPVLAPVLVSLLLIAGSLWAMRILDGGGRIRVEGLDWLASVLGALLILYTFVSDVVSQLSSGGVEAVLGYVPSAYNWPVFLAGYALMAAATLRIGLRAERP